MALPPLRANRGGVADADRRQRDTVWTLRYAFARLVDANAVGVVHIDAVLCGGLGEAMKIAALAAARHLPVSCHNSSSIVAFAANLHAAGAIGNAHSVEYHMVHRLLFDRAEGADFPVGCSFVIAPTAPGLGIHLDLDDLGP